MNTIPARRIPHANKTLRAMRRPIRASDIISSFSMITRRTITRIRRAIRAHDMISSFSISTRRTTPRSLRLGLPPILKLAPTPVPLSLLAVPHPSLPVVSQTMSPTPSRLREDDSTREEFYLRHEKGAGCSRSRRMLSMNRAMSEIT